nr:MAG TPA: hypothetical protein [Caudoviricetes sp.]
MHNKCVPITEGGPVIGKTGRVKTSRFAVYLGGANHVAE